ncbi:MAG TPA: metallophosphoesterase [Tenuifilaceae bacterium]|jgi:predicted MPP superfamily phosphohydrolase|nr:metallophosphoesterase [Bacteroidales bacterium]HNT41558.1 metallophosphoesterase [Tenuifilaceae bacterium]HNY08494.1 metallophosphoesterase [Tenuifilaceae bacterium]HPH00368.1 metallophosphoesterase [Tenuifilaceae bacterium]
MKPFQMFVFITITLGVYLLVNLFIYYQTRVVFSIPRWGILLKIIFLALVLAYPVGRGLEAIFDGNTFTPLVRIGSMWLGAMLYLFMAFLVVWIVVVSTHTFGSANPIHARQVGVALVYALVSILLIAGYTNAITPIVRKIEVRVDKPLRGGKLRVVAVSDIHLGTVIGKRDLAKLVKMANAQNPDVVLLVGDIFDEDVTPVINGGMGTLLEQFKSKYGVFAVTGNHEFYGGFEQKIKYLQQHGVKLLRDSTVLVDSSFYIIGRDDRQSSYMLKRERKSVEELISEVDLRKLTILLDHQPYNLDDAARCGVDLQLSGHTHNGQLWPFNYITKAMYEVSHGYYQKGGTHYYVSSGFGTWGPRLKIGNRSEVMVVEITGNPQNSTPEAS